MRVVIQYAVVAIHMVVIAMSMRQFAFCLIPFMLRVKISILKAQVRMSTYKRMYAATQASVVNSPTRDSCTSVGPSHISAANNVPMSIVSKITSMILSLRLGSSSFTTIPMYPATDDTFPVTFASAA